MTLRITASTVTFAASQTDAVAVSSVANLTDYVTTKVTLHPTAITMDPAVSLPSDLLISELILRAEKNPEVAHRLYKGPKVALGVVMGALGRDALVKGDMTAIEFDPDHGMELAFTYDNGTTAVNAATMLWDVQNAEDSEFKFGRLNAVGQIKLADAIGHSGQNADPFGAAVGKSSAGGNR